MTMVRTMTATAGAVASLAAASFIGLEKVQSLPRLSRRTSRPRPRHPVVSARCQEGHLRHFFPRAPLQVACHSGVVSTSTSPTPPSHQDGYGSTVHLLAEAGYTVLSGNNLHRPRHLPRRRGVPRVAPANIVGQRSACSGVVRRYSLGQPQRWKEGVADDKG